MFFINFDIKVVKSIHFDWEFVYPTLSTTPERFPIVSRPENAKNDIFSKNVVKKLKKLKKLKNEIK